MSVSVTWLWYEGDRELDFVAMICVPNSSE